MGLICLNYLNIKRSLFIIYQSSTIWYPCTDLDDRMVVSRLFHLGREF